MLDATFENLSKNSQEVERLQGSTKVQDDNLSSKRTCSIFCCLHVAIETSDRLLKALYQELRAASISGRCVSLCQETS